MQHCLSAGGDDDSFLPKILEQIRHADEVELAVSFIKSSGLNLIFQALSDAVELRNISLTVLTSDYLDVTDPQALRALMLLSERGADIRIFEAKSQQSFHLKAYIFIRSQYGDVHEGTAFVGSSNISKAALTDGIEWNYGVVYSAEGSVDTRLNFKQIRSEYRRLLAHSNVITLEYDWIDAYEKRREVIRLPVAPGSDDPELPAPEPNDVQVEALAALRKTRKHGYKRGLVVMATGLGKTYLAAFDAKQTGSKRILFVAHREEILLQAEASFQRIHRQTKVGRYTGKQKETGADIVFASVQTLGRANHLEKFPPAHFDYVVVDEFHHAAAPTYKCLLSYFKPKFMLGLTATPERTDQSDILSLCDDNLVFTRDLFHGIENGFLCPFGYYGIFDESVNYDEIPWRNGRFDPESLSNKLATLARARHAYSEWQDKAQKRTLAFCVSTKHADFMAERFCIQGVRAVAVHGKSEIDRREALEKLADGSLEVIFSVDLFNEGVDLPAIDTVMMLRPTESKVLFLQQLGRGLRRYSDKQRLIVLDFIGNHQGFLNKPQALFGIKGNNQALAEFAKRVKDGKLELPQGCFINFDLQLIDFLSGLAGDGPLIAYQTLKDSLGRRPTLTEYYRSGASLQKMRKQYGQWWRLVSEEDDLFDVEETCLNTHQDFFKEVETTAMNKSFKAVVLETLLENNGFEHALSVEAVASKSLDVFRRRRNLIPDIKVDLREIDLVSDKDWLSYWRGNPINAWTGGNKAKGTFSWFSVANNEFQPEFKVDTDERVTFHSMLQELVDYRLASYQTRLKQSGNVIPFPDGKNNENYEIPYFPNLQIACGHFADGRADADEVRRVGGGYGHLDPSRHFIARAKGDSMNGGKHPVLDGDYLLLERISSEQAGSITGTTMVIERQDVSGDDQYLLRGVNKTAEGKYILKASNPEYPDLEANEEMRTLARLRAVIDPLELAVGREFKREQIPELFGVIFNTGNWQSGHVVLNDQNAHVLLVTLNKQGKEEAHRYHDYFIDEHHFHWQSQNSTSPENKRGKELINHARLGIGVHLFVRENKLAAGKAAPFQYIGPVKYQKHEGSEPMSITWKV